MRAASLLAISSGNLSEVERSAYYDTIVIGNQRNGVWHVEQLLAIEIRIGLVGTRGTVTHAHSQRK